MMATSNYQNILDKIKEEANELVTEIFDEDRIVAAVDEKVAELARRPPIALRLIKQSLQRSLSMTFDMASVACSFRVQ